MLAHLKMKNNSNQFVCSNRPGERQPDLGDVLPRPVGLLCTERAGPTGPALRPAGAERGVCPGRPGGGGVRTNCGTALSSVYDSKQVGEIRDQTALFIVPLYKLYVQMFSRHPNMVYWPDNHGFFFGKLVVW